MIEVTTIKTPELGDRSYLVTDGTSGVVVDPQRDIERVTSVTSNITVTHVLDTHVHNDYITGGLALAAETGATYCLSAGEDLSFPHEGLQEGDEFESGSLLFSVLNTPGHTPTHLSFTVRRGAGKPAAVFTGGSLLYGSVGRTDLMNPDLTEELSRSQYRSVMRLLEELPHDAVIYPTHGFGSFCSIGPLTGGDVSTIGQERLMNSASRARSEDRFVEDVLSNLTAYPAYYSKMAPINRAGPQLADLSPLEVADADEVARRIETGEWVIDTRDRRLFAERHMVGTINIPLDALFATYLGWMVPWGSQLTLIADSPDQVIAAQRALCRIGMDRISAQASSDSLRDRAEGSYDVASFADLVKCDGSPVVLDTRRPDEFEAARLAGALNVPFYELPERLAEVPEEGEIWVHCTGGLRASIASSLLAREGRSVVLIEDEFEEAARAGAKIETGP